MASPGRNNSVEPKQAALSFSEKKFTPYIWVILASAVAHLWCLGSQFYMDDHGQICESGLVKNGNFTETGLNAWTYLIYHLQYRLFGISAVGFHGVNWLLHTAVACVLFALGKDLIAERWPKGVALFAALLFAVHPLASEIPNYARTQDLAWVTLFSLLATWAVLHFMKEGGWWKLAGAGVCILGATFSKGPGAAHALMMVSVVGLATMNLKRPKNALWIGAGITTLLTVLFLTGSLKAWVNIPQSWSDPRFVGHAYTLGRVFWEFTWRGFLPMRLSLDHHIQETLIPLDSPYWNIPDKVAMVAFAAFLAFGALTLFLAWHRKTRIFGVCLLLYWGTIFFRLFFLMPEFMPEYRIYPGLPWFCLGIAVALAVIWQKSVQLSPKLPIVILLGVLAIASARRSFLWHDVETLWSNVLDQYPTQARAVWALQERDLKAEKWQAVIERQQQLWPQVESAFIERNRILSPKRELPTGHLALAAVACKSYAAVATAHAKGITPALRQLEELSSFMRHIGLGPETHKIHWDYYHHSRGLVLEVAGNLKTAATAIKQAELTDRRKMDLERIEKKLAEQ